MRVYGVDFGTRRLAIACPEVEYVWSVDLEKGPGTAARKRRFRNEFEWGMELGRQARLALLDSVDGYSELTDALFIGERPFLRTVRPNVQTAVGMSLSAAAAMSHMPGDKVFLKHPSLWKKALVDNGNASKDDVQQHIERSHPALAEACRGIEDAFDAVGIALGGAALARAGRL